MLNRAVYLTAFIALVAAPILPTVEAKVKILMAGDSTMATTGGGRIQGWGAELQALFDPTKVEVQNHARAGRSSRSFLREGRFDEILGNATTGDYVIIEFGHNDNKKISADDHVGPIQSAGTETLEDTLPYGTKETVLTFGSYLRKYISLSQAKGLIPILSCSTPRGNFDKATNSITGGGRFVDFARDVAKETKVLFVDHNKLSADEFTTLGQTKVTSFFGGQPSDFLHTNTDGAVVNAATFVSGLKCFTSETNIQTGFSETGLAVKKAATCP